MKKTNSLKLVITLILILSSATFTFAQEKKSGKSVIKTNIYCDHCKECETCGNNFKTKMLKIRGVKMYELDEKAMTITVYYNSKKTNLKTIRTEISKLGYDADNVKADSKSYANLDNCCKKVS